MSRRPAVVRRRSPQPTRAGTPCPRGADIWPYLDGDLTPARTRAMVAHFGACESCMATARRLCAMLEECRSAGCRALPADVRARARARSRALLRNR